MPEVRDLSDALPELSMDPITGVGVVASRNRAPTGYDVVSLINWFNFISVSYSLKLLFILSNIRSIKAIINVLFIK